MTTQVVFKIDKALKDKAMAKAKKQGIAFAAVLKLATQAFIDDRFSIQFVQQGEETFNKKTQKEILEALDDIAQNKNLSPEFHSSKAADK